MQFGPDGACVHNPLGKGHIPVAARVDSYPLSEADGIVWIWFGNANPDPANIPGFAEFTDGERWATVEGHIHVAANYFLVADNLLDLSHAEFLHPDLASEGFNRRVKLTVRQEGDVICADNLRIAEPISRAFRIAMGGETAPDLVDRRSLVRWEAPANLTLHFDAYPTGRVDSGVTSIQAHLITPETATTCHYFYRIARDYLVGDEAASAQILTITDNAFRHEDKPMIEAQQKNLGQRSFNDLKPVLLKSDEAATRARRMLDARIAAEAAI